MTSSIAVEVAKYLIDTLKQKMFDIKDIQPAKDQINWWKSFKFWL
jgi:hypothetical protein